MKIQTLLTGESPSEVQGQNPGKVDWGRPPRRWWSFA